MALLGALTSAAPALAGAADKPSANPPDRPIAELRKQLENQKELIRQQRKRLDQQRQLLQNQRKRLNALQS